MPTANECDKLNPHQSRHQIQDLLSDAIALHRNGQLPEAREQCRRMLQVEPNQAETLHLMGVIAYQQGHHRQAVEFISKAIENKPAHPMFHNNLGLALEALDLEAEAKLEYEKAIQMDDRYADAHNNLGIILKKEGLLDAASRHFQQAINLEHRMPMAHLNFGKTLLDQGNLQAAIGHYQKAIELDPYYAKAYNNLGNALREQGQIDAAIDNFRQAVCIRPNYVGALNNLGNALRACNRLDEAFDIFTRAISAAPDSAESYCNLGNAFKDSGQYEKALSHYKHAIQLRSGFAEAHFNCAMVYLLTENFEEGWPEYEWRLQKQEWKALCPGRSNLPLWNGESFVGKKLLVYDEQGFGDTIQFVRYLPLVKSRGGRVIFETRRQLMRLFDRFPGVDELVERKSYNTPAREADSYIPLCSLPGIFKTRLETIPADIPYLHPNPDKVNQWRHRFSTGGVKVGLVWQGSSVDPKRSIDPGLFSPLDDKQDISLYGLQKDAAQSESMLADKRILNLGDDFKDFADTAGVIANLDLVISIDTSVAHLAGAMGKPVWILLPHVADWRWFLDRTDSPWYPTMRLFRQTAKGDWHEVIRCVLAELKMMAENQMHLELSGPKSDSAKLHYNQGNRFFDQNNLAEAISCYKKALEIRPDYFEAVFNLAKAHQERGNLEKAISRYQEATKLKPDLFQAYFNLGILFQESRHFQKAISFYEKALAAKPKFVEALNNMGTAYQKLNDFDKAISCFRKALELKPEFSTAYYNMGKAYYDYGCCLEAIKCYNRALLLNSDNAPAWYNMGKAFYEIGDFDQAMACYQRSIQIKSDNVNVLYDMGLAYRAQGRINDMIACYEKALQIKPNSPETHYNLAVAYKKLEKMKQAFSHCRKALELQPDFGEAFGYLIRLHQHSCDWKRFKNLSTQLDALTKETIEKGKKTAEAPMLSIRRHADPRKNLAVAKSWSDSISRRMSNSEINFSFDDRKVHKKKIVVGYLSNDFKNQAVTHLMVGLFRSHNRKKFKILCFSHGKDDGSDYRRQIKQHCDQFIDIEKLPHEGAAKRINEQQVDILVDLMGHTRGNRLEICALRPAPIQAGYLGFLGSTGSDFIDYIITDKIVTPKEHAPFYSEKFVYLPHCYQVNNNYQRISEKTFRRKDCGLPNEDFVFCCFNQPYKIDSIIFETWMNILQEVPKSVLWLLRQNDAAKRNLIQAAATKGVAPDRLVFANALPLEEHLARLKLADLAMDTRIYNGGATTSNALWSGVPVITIEGSHFVSRMTSSSLSAIGLHELVTQSPEQYKSIAVRLAKNPEELDAVKKKLTKNRLAEPLFDSSRFACNIERAYEEMWHIFIAGERPRQIEVNENSS
jgi:protein O-GlcNAc transferase